jgi:hypothetical protein
MLTSSGSTSRWAVTLSEHKYRSLRVHIFVLKKSFPSVFYFTFHSHYSMTVQDSIPLYFQSLSWWFYFLSCLLAVSCALLFNQTAKTRLPRRKNVERKIDFKWLVGDQMPCQQLATGLKMHADHKRQVRCISSFSYRRILQRKKN